MHSSCEQKHEDIVTEHSHEDIVIHTLDQMEDIMAREKTPESLSESMLSTSTTHKICRVETLLIFQISKVPNFNSYILFFLIDTSCM